MNCKKMTHQKASTSDVPKPFRGLRILLVDNDTTSLLQIASVLEDYSYKVTTTELATVALSILQERTDSFDQVIADYNMPEMACFKFIKSVKFLNDFPIILIATELQKGIVKEAMTKGACYFLKKPISTKSLKNVWQHVCRTRNYKNPNDGNAEIKTNAADQEAESQGAKIQEKGVLDTINLQQPENEQVGDNDQIENDVDSNNGNGKRVIRSISAETDGQGDFKRKRTEDEGDCRQSKFARDSEQGNCKILVGNGTKMEGNKKANLKEHGFEDQLCHKRSNWVDNVLNQSSYTSPSDGVVRDARAKLPLEFAEFQEFTVTGKSPPSFLKLLQTRDNKMAQIASQVSLNQRKFSNGLINVNQDVDSMRELASCDRLNQKQLYYVKRVKIDKSTKDTVEHKVQENRPLI